MAKQEPFNRKAGGHVDFPEGTGGITGMCALGGKYACLEIYKVDAFMRVKMADQIDPENKTPSLKHSRQVHTEYGSQNEILARILLQADKFAGMAGLSGDEEANFLAVVRGATEELISAQSLFIELKEEVASKNAMTHEEPTMISVPSVKRLDARSKEFIDHAKAYLNKVMEAINFLTGEKFSDAFFHKTKEWAEKTHGKDDILTKVLDHYGLFLKLVIDLRNASEHRNHFLTLKVENFKMDENGVLKKPTISLKGTDTKQNIDYNIDQDLCESFAQMMEKLVSFGELTLVATMSKRFHEKLPWSIVKIPKDKINPEVPIQYQMTMKFQ